MKIDIKTLLVIALFIGGIVSSHYIGIATAKGHADKKVEKLAARVEKKDDQQRIHLEKILDQVVSNGKQIIKMQTEITHISQKINR